MVARKLGVTKSAISKLRARGVRLGENKAVMGDMGKCGRKKLFSPEQNRWIKRKVEENPFLSPAQLKRIDEQRGWPMGLEMVKVRRIRESLQRQGLAAKRAAKKPNLTPAMIQKRIDWCLAHQHMSEEDWMKVEFSDESTFYQIRNASKLVRRPKGERFNPRFTVKTVKHPASVMVWGCFDGRFGRGRLGFLEKGVTMNSARYQDMLTEKLLPIFEARKMNWFLQDSAPCHASKSTREFLSNNHIRVLPWPGNSPDLNPIENLWLQMKLRVAQKEPTSYQDLIRKVSEVWVMETSREACEKLARSMPARIRATLANNGNPTKY